MTPHDFWCRAFLAELNGTCSRTMVNWEHERTAERLEKAADAALAVAQRRGMVTGELEAPGPAETPRDDGKPARVEAGQRWSMDFRDIGGAIEGYAVEAIGDELARLSGPRGVKYEAAREMLTSPRFAYIGPAEAPGPKLERVEFTAERGDHGLWNLSAPELGAGVSVLSGSSVTSTPDGTTVRIKWGESVTRPIEVWIERRG